MKSILLRLLGLDTPFHDYAHEVLTRPGLNQNQRIQLLRQALGLSANKQGRPLLGLTPDERKDRAKLYQRERYAKLKAEGRCVSCAEPNPNAPDHTRCDNCQKKNA
jgi:hypothetical protein